MLPSVKMTGRKKKKKGVVVNVCDVGFNEFEAFAVLGVVCAVGLVCSTGLGGWVRVQCRGWDQRSLPGTQWY